MTRRAALAGALPTLLARPARAASAAGIYALPTGSAKVGASLTLDPAPQGPTLLDVVMHRLGSDKPITNYQVELEKRLHLIAISDDFKRFVHEHGERPDADGHFRVNMVLPPEAGWHIYADAVPTGLPQQVMRFDVSLGGGAAKPPMLQPSGLEGSDGRYGIRFDSLDLRANKTAMLTFTVLRDGKPAPDLTPFLGVGAHAVFIEAATLSYIHVHAMAGGMDMQHASMPQGAALPSQLMLHVTPPRAGAYLLWLQFMGGSAVRTVRFVIDVK